MTPGRGPAAGRGFQLLAVVTAVAAYLQIALGGVVRISGSGLGCQDQWPLCNGHLLPNPDLHALIEYGHRTFGALATVLMLATFVLALALERRRRPVLAVTSGGALAVVALEIPLGALVVFHDLAGFLVLAHLAVAMAILGLLVATAVLARPAGVAVGRGTADLLAVLATLTFLVLLSGGALVAAQAGDDCNAWPLCGNGLTTGGLDPFTLIHRTAVLTLAIVAVAAAWRVRAPAGGGLRIATWLALAGLLCQAAVGAGAAVATSPAWFDGLHVAFAAATWALAANAALIAYRDRAEVNVAQTAGGPTPEIG